MHRRGQGVSALGLYVVVILLLACAIESCTALPLEGLARVRAKHQLAEARQKRGGPVQPQCPHHPPPIPQAFISKQFMPERLREATKRIDRVIQEDMRANSIHVASVGVVYDQELVWEKGYGLIDPSSPSSLVDSNTIMRVGSISKLITTVMLFQARDRGLISVDDPVSKYVPELAAWPTPFVNNPGITWRALAGEVSGLTGTIPCNFMTIWEPILGDACTISNEEAWKRIMAEPPTVPMWQYPHYADAGYAIIGRALESVVGMSWEDWVTQHIFKPLGMDSSYVAYDAWSDMAKRIPPGMMGNTTYPNLMSQMDLSWARPTGNVYSTVKDLAKLVSVFLVGRDERKNALGLYSSTLREMLTPAFMNDDQSSAYGYPFEIHHSSFIGADLPSYYIRFKGGVTPGYFCTIALVPEIKTAMIFQSTGVSLSMEPLAELLPAMEQTLWELQPLPANPGNLTAYSGSYWASIYGGLAGGNVTVKADLESNRLNITIEMGMGTVMNFGRPQAVWQGANVFRIEPADSGGCLDLESGRTNALVHFAMSKPTYWNPSPHVASLQLSMDPFYGWVFVKQ